MTVHAWIDNLVCMQNWRNGHPDILEEQETSRGEVEAQVVVETPGAGGVQQQQQPAAASPPSSSSTSAAEGWKSDRVPQSCRTTKPTFDFTALEVQSGSTTVGEKVEISDNLSRTQAWLNEAEDPGSLSNAHYAGPACNPARPFSPEIKEEDVDIISMERSALIEDQLPGRLSQSVRFIKPPTQSGGATGTPFLLPSTKEEKKMSSSSFRAFSSKIASKLSRLFFSKSTNASGGPPPRFAPPPAPAPGMRNSTITGSATTSCTTSESSTTESPTKLNMTSTRRTSSFRKWLQKPAGSKVASAAEPDPKPVVKRQEEEKSRAEESMPKAQQQQHKGKENVEVRNTSGPSFTTRPSHFSARLVPLLKPQHRGVDFWSRPETAITSDTKVTHVSPQEYARSVLGWEQSLVLPLRLHKSIGKQPSATGNTAGVARGQQGTPTVTAPITSQATQITPSSMRQETSEHATLVVVSHFGQTSPTGRGEVEEVSVVSLIDGTVVSRSDGGSVPAFDTLRGSTKSGAPVTSTGLQDQLSHGRSSSAEEESPCWSPVSQPDDNQQQKLPSCRPWCLEASEILLPQIDNPFAECSKYAGIQVEPDRKDGSLFELDLLRWADECNSESHDPVAVPSAQSSGSQIGNQPNAAITLLDSVLPSKEPWQPLVLTAGAYKDGECLPVKNACTK